MSPLFLGTRTKMGLKNRTAFGGGGGNVKLEGAYEEKCVCAETLARYA